MNLRKIYIILIHLTFVFSVKAQKELDIEIEKDEFCSYIKLSSANIEKLISSSDEDFQLFMEKKGFRKAELGKKNEYIASSSKLNHARLLNKELKHLQFTFSPSPSALIPQFLDDLKKHAQVIKTSQKNSKTTLIVKFPTLSPINQYQIIWEEKTDTEEYVGRTVKVKTLQVEVFSY